MNFPEALPSDTAQESLVVLKHCLLKPVSNASNRQQFPMCGGVKGEGGSSPKSQCFPDAGSVFPG